MVRTRFFCTFVILTVCAHGAIDGTALVTDEHIFKVNTGTGRWDTVISKNDFDNYHTLSGPCFSPDGRRIAYGRYELNTGDQDGTHILIADNDGGNITELCMVYRAGGTFEGGIGSICCSWANDGHIYWSEKDHRVCRVNVTTKAREVVAVLDDFSGDIPREIWTLKVSLDGTRGGCMGGGSSGAFGLDLVDFVSISYGSGCQGTVSPNGRLVTHNMTGGLGYSYHQVAFIHDFDSGEKIDTMIVTGAVQGQSGSLPRFVFHRFSHSSDDHVVFSGEDALGGKGFVYSLSSNETCEIGTCTPYDYWDGALPGPPAAGPRVELSPTALQFVSHGGATPGAEEVTVTNAGAGTLTEVTVQGVPDWLTVVQSGNGNTRTLTNSVDLSGLQPGVYDATITVSGGGASNAVNYTVTLNVALSLLAPSGLTASVAGPDAAELIWTDNTANETGFVVQRRAGDGSWTACGTTDADSASWIDVDLTTGVTYHYRVAAFAASDTSAWSNLDSVTLAAVASITVTSPRAGDTWHPGDTVQIRWTSENVAQVDLSYSPDGGESVLLIADRGIQTTDSEWGDYAWVVPALGGDSVMVRVAEYGNPNLCDWSPNVHLSTAAVHEVPCAGMSRRAGIGAVRRTHEGALSVTFSTVGMRSPRLMLLRLDGSLVGSTLPPVHAGRQCRELQYGRPGGCASLVVRLQDAQHSFTRIVPSVR